ncbi:BamA/OMP85 family outer membrane protein [Nannocystis punicea]|uniref:BamA/TamA family outer membrane protein n=1 Tax=Nannocystis punicea TaxID=2995304 RepID=A0ABY7GWA5_9BACT|nr:BamA/TamA family outer membrane protein [Nannocystis poenicansa]WAS91260.1 BamA/TamA family outer membrane protein [Nannocystis poenicansa]
MDRVTATTPSRATNSSACSPEAPRRRADRTIAACFAGAALVLGACAHKEDVRGSTADITAIEFVGVERFKKKELLKYLYMGETSRLPWRQRFEFLEANLPIDAERIVAVYAAYGYYEAQVVSITPRRRHRRCRRRDAVTIRVEVREGQPTPVRSVRLEFPAGPPSGPRDRRVTESALRKQIELREDRTFEIPALNRSVDHLQQTLQAAGYAHAEVKESAVVVPGSSADVRFVVRPGRFFRVGKLRFEGLGPIPERFVRNEVDYAPGRPYSPQLVRKVESAVYALDVFDTVTVHTRDGPQGTNKLDLVVEARPSRPQSIKLGAGFGLDPVRWEQRGSLLYTHRNLGANLTRFDLNARAGYAELPSMLNPREHGPIAKLDLSFRQKGLIEKRTTATLTPAFELGIWEGYQFYSPTLRAGLSRFFSRFVETEISYNFRFVDFFNVSPTISSQDTILGLDFRDPYFLSYIEPSVRLYLTDSVLQPKNGAILGLIYDLSGLGGDFTAHRVRPSLRLYWTPHRRLTFAGRIELGWIFPFGPRGGAPLDLRFYLGGADTVRGWGLRRLSPQVYPVGCTPGEADCRSIPVGGNTMILANLEARVQVTDMLSAVAFLDIGDVRAGINEFRLDHLNYSAGPGVRLTTPIGTFRLDLGVRLNESEYAPDQQRWAVHFGLGETF